MSGSRRITRLVVGISLAVLSLNHLQWIPQQRRIFSSIFGSIQLTKDNSGASTAISNHWNTTRYRQGIAQSLPPTGNNHQVTNKQQVEKVEGKPNETTSDETTSTKISVSSSPNPCTSSSSSFWNQSRFENIDDDPRLDSTHWYETLSHDPWSLVEQTICVQQSSFIDPRQLSSQQSNGDTDVDVWHIRLLYLGMYLHQHEPAMNEMKERSACLINQQPQSPPSPLSRHNNTNDYQCDASTKYLVASLPAYGTGVTFRNAAIPALLAGLSSNRVVTFVNQRSYGNNRQMQRPWTLASCPRGDYQCFFLPITPCVLTEEEMKQASKRATRTPIKVRDVMNQRGTYLPVKDDRVIVVSTIAEPTITDPDVEKRIRRRIRQRIKNLIQGGKLDVSKYHLPPHDVLEKVLLMSHQEYDEIQRQKYPNQSKYHFGLRMHHPTSTLHQAALLYILRPNWKLRQQMDQDFHSAIPNDLDTESSFGLPIRASDKCGSESMCLTFDQYMQLMRQQYAKYRNELPFSDKSVVSVILTSESPSILTRRHNYSTLSAGVRFQFVINRKDAGQGHGQPDKYGESEGPDADKIMLSTMVALKMQLMAKYTVVNCCSAFHRMLLDLLRAGCGASAAPTFKCLQEMDDPQFHLCCAWDQDERCQSALQEFRYRFQSATQDYARM